MGDNPLLEHRILALELHIELPEAVPLRRHRAGQSARSGRQDGIVARLLEQRSEVVASKSLPCSTACECSEVAASDSLPSVLQHNKARGQGSPQG